jgi:hypothetical protein
LFGWLDAHAERAGRQREAIRIVKAQGGRLKCREATTALVRLNHQFGASVRKRENEGK